MIPSTGFVRALSVLAGGTVVAHAITALTMPVLSRLYNPSAFGALAAFVAIVSTVSVAACLRYDVAVALPEAEGESIALLCISLISAMMVSAASAVLLAVGSEDFMKLIGLPELREATWLIPLAIFFASAWNALQSWHIRRQHFAGIAKARVAQSVITSSFQVTSGAIGLGFVGLLTGQLLGVAGSVIFFMRYGVRELVAWWGEYKSGELLRVAKLYRRFPIHSTWEALCNQAANQVPIIMIAGATSTSEAGYLMMAIFVLQAPMSLLGGAIGQVYLSRAPEAHRQGRLGAFTIEVLQNLIKVGAGPIVCVGIFAPLLFPVVFGDDWTRSGWLVAWLTPSFLFQFLASPVSMALHVVGAQRAALHLQIASLAMRVGVTWAAIQMSPGVVGEAFALSGAAVYLAYLLVILKYLAGEPSFPGLRRLRPNMLHAGIWVLGGLVTVLGLLVGRQYVG